MTSNGTVASTDLGQFELVNRGKVRDVYRIDESRLLFVATDRISAFDCVMPNQIPDKGHVLTAISAFWFLKLAELVSHHLISIDPDDLPEQVRADSSLYGRFMIVKSADVFPVECVVRGYLEGSGLKDYQKTGTICGHSLPKGLVQGERLPEPIFTPATKAASGHDENIDFDRFAGIIGVEEAIYLRSKSLELYKSAAGYAESKGIIIADTKFEFGRSLDGEIMLIDEVLTPDSSRFWDKSLYQPGRPQASFDKQFVREYLETLDWDKSPPAPKLPTRIVKATRERYLLAFETLTGGPLLK